MTRILEPLSDRVVVLPTKQEETKTSGGIYIPKTASKISHEGEVTAIGPDTEQVEVGDLIAYVPYGGVIYENEGIEYRVLREDDDILLVITEGNFHPTFN